MVSIWMNSLKCGLFTTLTVDELLWGYKDPLLARIAPTNPDVEEMFGLMYKACAAPHIMKSWNLMNLSLILFMAYEKENLLI